MLISSDSHTGHGGFQCVCITLRHKTATTDIAELILGIILCITYQTDLEWDLYKNVFGQHLAQDIVSLEVESFLKEATPDRPLVLSFHGSSGTGKTLVSHMLGNHLYGSAMSSQYVHQFIPTLHFPSQDLVEDYKVGAGLLCS